MVKVFTLNFKIFDILILVSPISADETNNLKVIMAVKIKNKISWMNGILNYHFAKHQSRNTFGS